jgi:hypothetical protein
MVSQTVKELVAGWSARSAPALDRPLEAAGVRAGIGDRDFGLFEGERYSLVEGQFVPRDETTWRCFLYQWSTRSAVLLDIQTLGGSLAFANPTFTLLHSPAGAPALLITLLGNLPRAPARDATHVA